MNAHFTSEQIAHRSFWERSALFCVQNYQRDYVWSEGNLDDLLVEFLNNSNKNNYLGEVVVQQESTRSIILCGQQKLISIQLLGWAIVQLLEEWIEAGQDVSNNRKRIELIQQITGSPENPKIELNLHVNSFYQTYICRKGHPGTLTRYKPAEQFLYRFYEYFLKHLRQRMSDAKEMDVLLQQILQHTTISVVNVSTLQDAYGFLLSRQGTEADVADLFKSHLINVLETSRPDAVVKSSQSWQLFSSQFGNFNFMEFVRLYWCSTRGYVRKQSFFDVFCKQLVTATQVMEFIQELHQAMPEFLVYLRKQSVTEKTDIAVAMIRTLRSYQVFPLLLAAKQHLSKYEFSLLAQDLVAIVVRYLVICHRNPHDLEQACAETALAVRKGEYLKAYDVFQSLRRFFIPDEIFAHDFAMWTVDTRLHNDVAFWMLASIELHLNPDAAIQYASVEHILPENPTFSWNLLFQHHTEEWVYRLGNLCLVEKINAIGEQRNFEEKIEGYRSSKWISTQKIAEYEDWNSTIITHRQRELAEIACQIWRGGH